MYYKFVDNFFFKVDNLWIEKKNMNEEEDEQ